MYSNTLMWLGAVCYIQDVRYLNVDIVIVEKTDTDRVQWTVEQTARGPSYHQTFS